MTSFAMTAGMLPMALGFGEGGEQTAPLGRAVVGGLVFATVATLTVLPAVFASLQQKARTVSASLDPGDTQSPLFEQAAIVAQPGQPGESGHSTAQPQDTSLPGARAAASSATSTASEDEQT
jgi:hypothetical protein